MLFDYINGLLTDAYEVHGDRHYVDDHAIVCYFGFVLIIKEF